MLDSLSPFPSRVVVVVLSDPMVFDAPMSSEGVVILLSDSMVCDAAMSFGGVVEVMLDSVAPFSARSASLSDYKIYYKCRSRIYRSLSIYFIYFQSIVLHI